MLAGSSPASCNLNIFAEVYNMAKQRCFVLYERNDGRSSTFIEVDDIYITGSLFKSLKKHIKDLIANLYKDRYGSILILDFKVIASV